MLLICERVARQRDLVGSSLVAGRGRPSRGQGGTAGAPRVDDDLDPGERRHRMSQRRGRVVTAAASPHPAWPGMGDRERDARVSSLISVLGPGPAT
jgi:hypothetical protein